MHLFQFHNDTFVIFTVPFGCVQRQHNKIPVGATYNNNNNTLIYIAPACRMTSEALADSSSRATECLTESSVLSLRLNPLIELQCNVSESNEFQTEGAQHRKARSAKCVLVVGL